jgi:hypothetical protein
MIRAAGVLLLLATAAAADEPVYRDDRSDPAAIVRSLYNAVARGEYARAWSYFGDGKPVADYAGFAAGYAGTTAVELVVGAVTTEGAAGSRYGTVPVAVAATTASGTQVFAGCYTTRMLQPAIQEPPFRPLEIVSDRLHPAHGALADALPACGDAR